MAPMYLAICGVVASLARLNTFATVKNGKTDSSKANGNGHPRR
jgi:hypothetical protein